MVCVNPQGAYATLCQVSAVTARRPAYVALWQHGPGLHTLVYPAQTSTRHPYGFDSWRLWCSSDVPKQWQPDMEAMPEALAASSWHIGQVHGSQRPRRPTLQEPYGFYTYRIPGDGQ